MVSPDGGYTYDAVYRLVAAIGRKQIALNTPPDPWDGLRVRLPHKADGTALQGYLQQYEYDAAGNMAAMAHLAGAGLFTNRWTRKFAVEANTNRLASSTAGVTTEGFSYDVHGNLTATPHLATIGWDVDNHLRHADLGGGHAWYTYDAEGQRARKVVQRPGGLTEERLYMGALEVFRRTRNGVVLLERESLPVLDHDRRLALIDTRTAGDDGGAAQLIRYQFSNHLGTATLEPNQLQALGTHLALHGMTFGNDMLVAALKVDGGDPHAVRKVAQMNAQDWEQAMERGGVEAPEFVAGADAGQKRANFATLLTLQFHRAYPTAAFTAGLQRDLQSGRREGVVQGDRLAQFFGNNPDFELATMGIERYVREKASPDTAALANDPAFVQQLKATQRVFKLAPDYDATAALLGDGVHSAQQIYRMGKQAFTSRYGDKAGFTPKSAELAYERAASTHAAAVAVVGELHATDSAGAVFALNSGSMAVSDFPNLANLFGKADACDCDQCRSVFSAAAYLADILMYLEQRKATDGVTSAKAVLFRRRPDIGDIELSCANTNTTLPYIDLACEILEGQVAPWVLFDLPGALTAQLAKGPASAALRTAFAGAVPPVALSPAATVSGPDHLGQWVLRDTDASGEHTWRIRPAAGQLEISVLRQTRGTPEELSANPEYVNVAAYQLLAAADYPMALPFDLPAEEVRAYLGQIGVRRSSIMEAFRGPAAPNNPTDVDIAAEHIGVAPDELAIIFAANAAQQFLFWGEADNAAAIAAYSHVDTFLDRTGLSYQDLQTLLTLGFVNPAGQIAILHLDASCDTSQQRIQPLDAPALDRIHRFLRLWRKLGWAMADLDLVIRNKKVGNGTIDNAFLVQLYPFLQMRERLGSPPIEQCCALFDSVNTQSRFADASVRPTPSLYERLFLNKRVMDKLDPAFAIALVTAADATPGAAPDISPDHRAAVLAAVRTSDADLDALLGLVRPVADPGYALRHAYLDGKLSLGNLSFLYRHASVLPSLRIKAVDWSRLLYLLQQDVFQSPAALLAALRLYDRSKAAGYSVDELAYILAAAGAVAADRLWVGAADDLASALGKLTAFTAAQSSRNAVFQQLSQALALTPAVVEKLLAATLFGAPKHALLQDFLDAGFAGSASALTPAAFPALFQAFYWLHRVALVLGKSKAGFIELDWAMRNAAATGVLDFTTLPLAFDPNLPAVTPPGPLLDFARFIELEHAFPLPGLSLLDVLDRVVADAAYTNAMFAADVGTLTGWPEADVQLLTTAGTLDAAYPAAFRSVLSWDRLVRCFDLLAPEWVRGLGAPARRADDDRSGLAAAEATAAGQVSARPMAGYQQVGARRTTAAQARQPDRLSADPADAGGRAKP